MAHSRHPDPTADNAAAADGGGRMPDFDDPITLCSDCSARARHTVVTRPIDDGPRPCEWCDTDVESPVKVVERQPDPGPLPWQHARDTLFEWLETHDHLDDIRRRDDGIGFTIGAVDKWPEYTNEDHITAIRPSSISLGRDPDNTAPFEAVKLHLPPAHETLHDPIDDHLELPDDVTVHYGTEILGGIASAGDGVITPHIVAEEPLTINPTKATVQTAIDVYLDVYRAGKEILRVPP